MFSTRQLKFSIVLPDGPDPCGELLGGTDASGPSEFGRSKKGLRCCPVTFEVAEARCHCLEFWDEEEAIHMRRWLQILSVHWLDLVQIYVVSQRSDLPTVARYIVKWCRVLFCQVARMDKTSPALQLSPDTHRVHALTLPGTACRLPWRLVDLQD